jgi:hypothetical protein
MFEHLPGGEILEEGLRDLQSGRRSVNALLVLIGRPRLSACGIEIPALPPKGGQFFEHELYDRLVSELGREAGYSRYNSLIRRLVSLERALESLRSAGRRETP